MKLNSTYFIFIASFVILSLLANLVNADIQVNTYTPSTDFTFTTAYSAVSVCSCAQAYDAVTLTNTGTWPAVFSLSINHVSSKIAFSENNFELQPGQSKDVYVYITADCGKGTDNLQITATSNLGTQKVLAKNIVRDRCQNVAVYFANYSKDVNPCQPRNVDIYIQNTGTFKDDFTISSNYDQYITYNANKITLDTKQNAKITATVKFDCNIYGTKDILFSAHSVNNRLTANADAILNIARNYTYDVQIGGKTDSYVGFDVCNRVLDTQIPVIIKNTGSVANNYTLQFKDLPKYAKVNGLDSNVLSLKPSESKYFTIDIDSTMYRYEHKTLSPSLTITPLYGDIIQTKGVTLNFLSCYEPVVTIVKADNSEKNPLQSCSGYMYNYDVVVSNNGRYKENMLLSLDGNPSSVSLSKYNISVLPGKNITVKLSAIGPEYNTVYDIKVTATLSNSITSSDSLWMKSYDESSCHLINVDNTNYRVNYQTTTLDVALTNKGVADGDYVVSWNGSRLIQLDDTQITLNKSQTTTLSLKVNSYNLSQGAYKGNLVIESSDSNAAYSQPITVTLKDKTFFTKAFEYLFFGTVCRQFSLYEMVAILAVIILIIIFMIVGPKYPYNFWNRFKMKVPVLILLVVIFLVGLILVITLAGYPKTQSQVYNLTTNASSLRYEWLQNNNYVLDVTSLFYSPENSSLKYTVTGLSHIKTSVNGRLITFYPDYGWSGVEYANIRATDRMGGNVTSPDLTLVVRNVPRKSITQLYNIYCWYVNLVIFLIILILVFIASFVKQKKRTRK